MLFDDIEIHLCFDIRQKVSCRQHAWQEEREYSEQ